MLELGRTITLDIETCPDMRAGAEEAARSRISAPSNYKDPEKIAAYVAEKGAEAWRKTSLDGTYGEILMIGYAFGDDEPQVLRRTLESGSEGERYLLATFWDKVMEWAPPLPLWVGQRVGWFDLKFLFQRSVIHRVRPTRKIRPDMQPWGQDVFDVSYAWTGERSGGIKLDALAEALGLPSPKDIMDGSEVYDAALAGEYNAIAEYCAGDVRTAREIYKIIGSLNIGYE